MSETFFPSILMACAEETKHIATKANIRLKHKNTTRQNKHKKAKAKFGPARNRAGPVLK